MDGHGDKAFNQAFETYLRNQFKRPNGKTLYKKLKFEDSRKSLLIQLADMCAGMINHYCSGKGQGSTLYKLLTPRVENLWEFK